MIGECYVCGRYTDLSFHEALMGRNRQLSIKYGLRVPLCFTCHRLAHDEPSQELNNKLKQDMRERFEINYPELDFIEIFK